MTIRDAIYGVLILAIVGLLFYMDKRGADRDAERVREIQERLDSARLAHERQIVIHWATIDSLRRKDAQDSIYFQTKLNQYQNETRKLNRRYNALRARIDTIGSLPDL